ncbi:MAG: translation initiation factor IF-3 [Malacoplasma sp.]|nr:translation initiation factor IF-3 [Malacoplasma sp.]
MNKKFIINESIRDRRLLIIDANGNKLGEMDRQQALDLAKSQGLDLVLFSTGEKPIAKIIDFGKYSYESKKKNKENKKNQVKVKNKEIKIKPTIGDHDLQVRVRNAKEWLNSGFRVRFVILTYGRIATKVDLVFQLYNRFLELVGDCATVQQPLKKASNVQYECYLIPAKK